MGDSDRSTKGFDLEDLREQIARRKLLLGAAALGSGSILITQSNSTKSDERNYLVQAENRLVEVAELITNVDLVDPRQNSILHQEISGAVDSVTNVLNQRVSDESQTKQQVSALRAATDYYSTLATTLNSGTTLLANAADLELKVVYHTSSLRNNPVTEFNSDPFNESISRLTQAEKDPETVISKERKLVPNQQQVIESLNIQRDVFDRHLTAQQTYLDTARVIEAGIRAYEKSQFDAARSKLTEARESLKTGIPKTEVSYRLSNAGLSLNQHATLLTLRQKGVTKLLSVCEESVSEHQRRAVTNTALDHFFEARSVVTN